jgi:D-aminoacyl-tRNA deacylase
VIYLVYCDETASSNIADAVRNILNLDLDEPFSGLECWASEEVKLFKIPGSLINADFVDNIVDDTTIFLSRHSSSKGIAAFTVHATGNWTEDNSLGGKPKALSISSPSRMLNVLSEINHLNNTEINVTYEATHHGPYMNHPSFFVELGGNEETVSNKSHAHLLARAVVKSFKTKTQYEKVAVGIGGMHYSDKFTKLALAGRYAFSHIISKYYVSNTDMLKAAFERSDIRAEIAVMEWKSIKAADRESIIRELSSLGIDYAKV